MQNAIISVGVFAAVGVLLFFGFHPSDDQGRKLEALDFISQYQNTPAAVLIDVRTPQEFSEGHLNTAINIDSKSATFTVEIEKLDKNKTYFVYCRSGNRSAQAVAHMQSKGFTHLYDLKGGITSSQGQLTLVTDSATSTE